MIVNINLILHCIIKYVLVYSFMNYKVLASLLSLNCLSYIEEKSYDLQ